jgi:hypothetical protein
MQLSNLKISSLLCPTCGEYRSLTFLEKSFSEKNKTIKYNFPYFKCNICNIEEPIISEDLVIEDARKQLKNFQEGSNVYLMKGEKYIFKNIKV